MSDVPFPYSELTGSQPAAEASPARPALRERLTSLLRPRVADVAPVAEPETVAPPAKPISSMKFGEFVNHLGRSALAEPLRVRAEDKASTGELLGMTARELLSAVTGREPETLAQRRERLKDTPGELLRLSRQHAREIIAAGKQALQPIETVQVPEAPAARRLSEVEEAQIRAGLTRREKLSVAGRAVADFFLAQPPESIGQWQERQTRTANAKKQAADIRERRVKAKKAEEEARANPGTVAELITVKEWEEFRNISRYYRDVERNENWAKDFLKPKTGYRVEVDSNKNFVIYKTAPNGDGGQTKGQRIGSAALQDIGLEGSGMTMAIHSPDKEMSQRQEEISGDRVMMVSYRSNEEILPKLLSYARQAVERQRVTAQAAAERESARLNAIANRAAKKHAKAYIKETKAAAAWSEQYPEFLKQKEIAQNTTIGQQNLALARVREEIKQEEDALVAKQIADAAREKQRAAEALAREQRLRDMEQELAVARRQQLAEREKRGQEKAAQIKDRNAQAALRRQQDEERKQRQREEKQRQVQLAPQTQAKPRFAIDRVVSPTLRKRQDVTQETQTPSHQPKKPRFNLANLMPSIEIPRRLVANLLLPIVAIPSIISTSENQGKGTAMPFTPDTAKVERNKSVKPPIPDALPALAASVTPKAVKPEADVAKTDQTQTKITAAKPDPSTAAALPKAKEPVVAAVEIKKAPEKIAEPASASIVAETPIKPAEPVIKSDSFKTETATMQPVKKADAPVVDAAKPVLPNGPDAAPAAATDIQQAVGIDIGAAALQALMTKMPEAPPMKPQGVVNADNAVAFNGTFSGAQAALPPDNTTSTPTPFGNSPANQSVNPFTGNQPAAADGATIVLPIPVIEFLNTGDKAAGTATASPLSVLTPAVSSTMPSASVNSRSTVNDGAPTQTPAPKEKAPQAATDSASSVTHAEAPVSHPTARPTEKPAPISYNRLEPAGVVAAGLLTAGVGAYAAGKSDKINFRKVLYTTAAIVGAAAIDKMTGSHVQRCITQNASRLFSNILSA